MSVQGVLRKTVSWLAVLFGFALGVFGFGLLGVEPLTALFSPPSAKTWLDGLTLFAFGSVPLFASIVAFRNRRLASLVCLIAAPLVSLVVWLADIRLAEVIFYPKYFAYQYSNTASAAIIFVTLLLLGYFWSIAHRYHWPVITAATKMPPWTKLTLAAVTSLAFLVCVCATSVRAASSWELPGDCGGPPAFSKPYPGHAVFIARVVNVDAITGAMAVVQQRFGGLPWGNKIVFLKFINKKGTYFIDGRFEEGIVTRWVVPVLDLKCTGSCPIEAAGVELRLFRDSPHWDGVRIIGRVLEPPGMGLTPASGATVIVEGPRGSVVTVTNSDGIYDLSGLPPGHYSIRLPSSGFQGTCRDFREGVLKSGDVWGCNLLTNGSE